MDSSATAPTRLHDLRAVLLNFKTMIHLLKTGYRFEDEEMTAIIPQLEKSLETLQKEISLLEKSRLDSKKNLTGDSPED